MKCIYFYKGHRFDSELELDSFLVSKEQYYNEFGDIVFDVSERHSKEKKKLYSLLSKNNSIWHDYLKLRKENKIEYDEDGDPFIIDKFRNEFRYDGVNSFLSGKTNSEGKLYFPYFDKDNFFKERKKDWTQGNFNEKEIDLFFDGDKSKVVPISDPATQNLRQKQMEEKWNAQGKAGTAFHRIPELFFSNKDIHKLTDDQVFAYVKSTLAKDNLLQYLDYNGSADENIREGIKIAKQIYQDINTKYPDAEYFTEVVVTGKALNDNNKEYNLFGKIDLLVLDKDGNYHIYDYKTSIKHYSDYDTAKQNAYSYQLATYRQMLVNAGLSAVGCDVNIIPVQLKNFENVNGNYQFNGCDYTGIINIGNLSITQTAQEEIQRLMPCISSLNLTMDDSFEDLKLSDRWFPSAHLSKVIDDKYTENYLNRKDVFKKKNDKGKYEFVMNNSKGKRITIESDSKAEMIQTVKKELQLRIPTRHSLMVRTKAAIKEAIANESLDGIDLPRTFVTRDGSATWLRNMLLPYANQEWEVLDDLPGFDEYEIIALHNKNTGQLDLINISTDDLHRNFNQSRENGDEKKSRTSILGEFETDAQAEQKYRRLIFKGIVGNAELMRMMLILNGTKGFEQSKNLKLGRMMVINPYDAQGVTASNEELLINFNALNSHVPVKENKFDSGDIQMCSYYDLLENELAEIWTIGEKTNWKDPELRKYRDNLNSCKSEIDKAKEGDQSDKLKAVQELLVKMRIKETFNTNNILSQDSTDLADLNSRKIRLFNMTLFTLAELRGIHFRQQFEDHHKWFSSIHRSLTKGQSGNYTDNPGNLDSETLNLITSLVKEAYQNTRLDVQKEKVKLEKIISKLKEDVGFTYLKENLGFNQADLYKPIYKEVTLPNGDKDLYFKSLNELEDQRYRPLLEYLLDSINSRRLNTTDDKLAEMKAARTCQEYPEYYQVPLARGSLDSEVSARGLFQALKDKLKYLDPRNWPQLFDEIQEKMQGLGYSEKRAKDRATQNVIYQLENYFDRGETDRENVLKSVGIDKIERNAQTLALKHIFAYSQKEHIDNIFPLIQAASVHLSIQGANAGKTFEADKSYLDDYIRSKIKKETIVTPELQGVNKVLNILKSAASKMTLAFTPVQMLYQPLQGLWNDISLRIRKPDGKESFTFEHFKTALKIVYGDLFNFSGKPTLSSLINEYYALNDMDINKYIDAISKSKKGFLYNFSGMAFKFASRPDFYNRVPIFLAQMQGDGCLEAHSVVNGELKYDWKKDKRFSKFAADPKNKTTRDPEYLKQKSLYYAIAKQFVDEGAKNADGSLFELNMDDPMDLPRAYTTKQAEGYKSLADDMYGYYTEENKSLIQATALGSMWLQFKTYWSGKKNQYLQSGGIRMRGTWENYTEVEKDENGNKVMNPDGTPKLIEYYYDIKENGEVDYTKVVKKEELPPEKQLMPVTYWKGQWQEGIMVTLSKLAQDRHIIRNYHKMMAEDPDMARCYKSNLKQLGYDMMLFLIGGTLLGGALTKWLKELLNENKDNEDFMKGCQLAAANVAVWTVKNSFLDFNLFQSIGEPLTSWTPFAIQFTSNSIGNLSKFVVGDQDLWDTAVRTHGWTKQVKPIFDAIKPEMYRTKQEGGTWQTRSSQNKE